MTGLSLLSESAAFWKMQLPPCPIVCLGGSSEHSMHRQCTHSSLICFRELLLGYLPFWALPCRSGACFALAFTHKFLSSVARTAFRADSQLISFNFPWCLGTLGFCYFHYQYLHLPKVSPFRTYWGPIRYDTGLNGCKSIAHSSIRCGKLPGHGRSSG